MQFGPYPIVVVPPFYRTHQSAVLRSWKYFVLNFQIFYRVCRTVNRILLKMNLNFIMVIAVFSYSSVQARNYTGNYPFFFMLSMYYCCIGFMIENKDQ